VTDGPFKNLKLGSCWKRLAEAIQLEAVSPLECACVASDALVRHLTTSENCSALNALEACSRGQLDCDPLGLVEAIFDVRETTPVLDRLKKELQFRIANGSSLEEVTLQALDATIEDQIGEARNRFVNQLICNRDTHVMTQEAYQQALDKINAAFDVVDRRGIRDAFRAGNKNAFRDASGKKEGLDEGPRL
jgi:hypothetical protein